MSSALGCEPLRVEEALADHPACGHGIGSRIGQFEALHRFVEVSATIADCKINS
jgi:hypothetical protein